MRRHQKGKGAVGPKADQQQNAVNEGYPAVPCQKAEQQRCHDQNGPFASDHGPFDSDREDQRGDRKNQQQIGDVAADDVANDNIVMACQHGVERNDKFRCRGSEGDDGQADDKRRDFQRCRQLYRMGDKIMPTAEQQ